MYSLIMFKNQTIEQLAKGAYKELLLAVGRVIILAVSAIIIGIIIGSIIASVSVAPKYKKSIKIWDKINQLYVYLFRGTPFIVQLLVIYYVLIPLMKLPANALATAIAVMGLNSGAYASEIIRGGINSVDSGQLEAGRVVGMSYTTSMRKIVIPQAIKNIVPTLGNEFITLLKDTSVVSFITLVDITKVFQNIANSTYDAITSYLLLGLIYLILVLIATIIVKLIEKRMKKNERKK